VTTGFADFRGHQTWYRVTGELEAAADPFAAAENEPVR
jgi:hypothetical protein